MVNVFVFKFAVEIGKAILMEDKMGCVILGEGQGSPALSPGLAVGVLGVHLFGNSLLSTEKKAILVLYSILVCQSP